MDTNMTNESELNSTEEIASAIIGLMVARDVNPVVAMAAMSMCLLSTCAANGVPKEEALRVIAANATEVYDSMELAETIQ